MSIVIGIAVGKHRLIAGDQRVSNDDGHKFDKAPKVYKLKSGLLGFTGSIESERKLVELLRKVSDPTLETVKLPHGEYSAIFLSVNGKCYQVAYGKAAVAEKATVFCAGAAYQYAHGAIYGYCKAKKWKIETVTKRQMIELVRLGCKTAIDFNNTCGGRVQVKYLEVT